ncbi:S-adenosylmethionine:tRNA-ribosyltransferase-isomerase (queuine synthetase) [Chlamydia trachomatis]|nr:S-adenosylmethionine:tRNA-ribosyltransferase-isomerase (queuine synthetase) [Chlamydia trachomatis]
MDTKNIHISDFNYELPDERIAKYPLPQRDHSKLPLLGVVFSRCQKQRDYATNRACDMLRWPVHTPCRRYGRRHREAFGGASETGNGPLPQVSCRCGGRSSRLRLQLFLCPCRQYYVISGVFQHVGA